MKRVLTVGEYYLQVAEKYGETIANRFYHLMYTMSGGKNTSNEFYSEDILEIKLKEAQDESC